MSAASTDPQHVSDAVLLIVTADYFDAIDRDNNDTDNSAQVDLRRIAARISALGSEW